MLSFFFKQRKHNDFDYQPRFFNPEEEERKKKLEILRANKDFDKIKKTNKDYVPGSIIREGFQENTSEKKKKRKNYSYVRIAVFLIIIIMAIYLLQSEWYVKFISNLLNIM